MAAGKPPSNVGCVLAIVALPLVIVVGIVIGTVLRSDDDPTEEQHVTLDEGEIAGTAWRIDAVRDVEGETCVFIYLDGTESQRHVLPRSAGRHLRRRDDRLRPRRHRRRRGSPSSCPTASAVDIDTTTADGIDGRFYVTVVDGDVDAVALGCLTPIELGSEVRH